MEESHVTNDPPLSLSSQQSLAVREADSPELHGIAANNGMVDLLDFTASVASEGANGDIVSQMSDHVPEISKRNNEDRITAPDHLGLTNPGVPLADSSEKCSLEVLVNGSNMDTVDNLDCGESSARRRTEAALNEGTQSEDEKRGAEESTADNKLEQANGEVSSASAHHIVPSSRAANHGPNGESQFREVSSKYDELKDFEQNESTVSNDEEYETRSFPEGSIKQLESDLCRAEKYIAELKSQLNDKPDKDAFSALQNNLQQQMTNEAETSSKLRLAEAKIANLEDETTQQAANLESLQTSLEQQMSARAEAEYKARTAYDRIQQLEREKEENAPDLRNLQEKVFQLQQEKASQEIELEKARTEREEYERKAMALTSELNLAKKKEAVKVNLAEEFEEDLKNALEELEAVRVELQRTLNENAALKRRLETAESTLKERVESFESALREERQLNEDRKAKMKEFVEKKVEEVRQSKEENDSVQMELAQTNRSLIDLNNRWKQLHTQWVQAQTRNRELQRDLNRIKKDSETLHKQGDTLEMKLSRSANETEEHKNKRLAAKHELMAVLRTLDAERDVTAKLRDKIKFSFTPKALVQHQMLNNILDEFETSLEKLSLRLGKPLPPSEDTGEERPSDAPSFRLAAGEGHTDLAPLVEKLERESELVSQAIQVIHNNVGRLRAVVDASGNRTCFSVLSELVTTGGMMSSPALRDGHETATAMTDALRPRFHGYGQVPGSADH